MLRPSDNYKPNGNVLSAEGRQNYAGYVDSVIKQFSDGLELLKGEYTTNKCNPNLAYSNLVMVIDDLDMFATMTFIDCLIASKLFILAEEDYEKKFLRGKLQVVLNEGFKKLYGFGKGKANSKWKKIEAIQSMLPPFLQTEYIRITNGLEAISNSFNWWKEERNVETHIDAFALYDSRCIEIDESQVMMDSLRLIDVLNEVQNYTTKVHGCYVNTINLMCLSVNKA